MKEQLKQYALEYLSLHNEEIREIWENREGEFFLEMLNGNHGELHGFNVGDYDIEIKGRESFDGHPTLFTFPKELIEV